MAIGDVRKSIQS